MATTAIPESLRAEVLRRAGEGERTEAIAAWLLAEHKVQLTGRAVRRFLARARADRTEITKTVLAEKLGKTVTADLDALNGLLDRARGIEEFEHAHVDTRLKAIAEQRKLLELRFKLSGAGDDSNKDDTPRGLILLPAVTPDE